MSDLKEFDLGKFTFREDPWKIADRVSMEWIEESNYCMFPDDEKDMDINKDEAEKLITFLADSLNISLRDLAHRNRS